MLQVHRKNTERALVNALPWWLKRQCVPSFHAHTAWKRLLTGIQLRKAHSHVERAMPIPIAFAMLARPWCWICLLAVELVYNAQQRHLFLFGGALLFESLGVLATVLPVYLVHYLGVAFLCLSLAFKSFTQACFALFFSRIFFNVVTWNLRASKK